MRKSKRALLALTAVGALAVAGAGAGTFASFSAQVTNSNNTFATGDLSLSDTANATTCYSSGTTTSDTNTNATNANSGCSALITSATPLAPSGAPYFAPVALKNIGNLTGALSFWGSSPVTTTLSTALTSGTATTTLSVAALSLPVTSGDALELISGKHTATLAAGAAASVGATSITVSSFTPTFSFPVGTEVVDTAAASCIAGAGQDTTSGAFTGSGTLCNGLQVALFKSASTSNATPAVGDTCVWGCTASTTWGATNATLTNSLSTGTASSLAVTSLTANVSAGDTLVVSSGTHSQTFTVGSGGATAGASATIPIVTTSVTYAFPASSTVVDASTTLTNFNTNLSGLPASGSAVSLDTGLAASSSDDYYLALYFPNSPTSGADNQYMNEDVHFSLTWHLEQTTS